MAQLEFFPQNVHVFTMSFSLLWLANTLLVEQGNWVSPYSLIFEMAEIFANHLCQRYSISLGCLWAKGELPSWASGKVEE